MFLRYRTLGFVFKKEERGEVDQVFKVFSKDFGKVEILGKGIRKISSKLRSGMETFYLSEIEFVQGKIYKTLTDAVLIERFKNLRKNLKKLSVAYQISEILDNLIKGEERDEKIWNLILGTFEKLDDPNLQFKICNLQYYYFFWNLISFLGHKPEVYSCIVCQKKLEPKGLYFNKKEGGIVCQSCFQKIKEGERISGRVVKILRILLEKDIQFLRKVKVDKEDFENLKKISDNYFNFLSEKNYENKIF
jgi:DNA repair protein RecO (recombination protein O)